MDTARWPGRGGRWRGVFRFPFVPSNMKWRLPGGGKVLSSFSILATSLVGKQRQGWCPNFGRAELWSPERETDWFKVTQHISDRAEAKNRSPDFWSGAVVTCHLILYLPHPPAWNLDRTEQWLARLPGALFCFLSCLSEAWTEGSWTPLPWRTKILSKQPHSSSALSSSSH